MNEIRRSLLSRTETIEQEEVTDAQIDYLPEREIATDAQIDYLPERDINDIENLPPKINLKRDQRSCKEQGEIKRKYKKYSGIR